MVCFDSFFFIVSFVRIGIFWIFILDDNFSYYGYFSNIDGCYMFQCYLWGMFNFIGKLFLKCSIMILRLLFYILFVFCREVES